MWIAVRQRFTQLHSNLTLTPMQQLDGHTKSAGVVNCLNRYYYGTPSDVDNSFWIGSWAKATAVRPPRDVDLYFLLPQEVYHRFQGHIWNRQSALLQEVKGVLTATYPNTDMRGDGQVVIVRFGSYNVEVVPAFQLSNGYWICDTHNGGSYKTTQPWAEVDHIDTVNRVVNGNLSPLIRMLKVWQEQCSVPIKSFQLELVSADFILQSPWRYYDFFWFDWIVRDFFAYLYNRAYTYVTVPGTYQLIPLGADWQSRAQSAYNRAVKACYYEQHNLVRAAGDEWQGIASAKHGGFRRSSMIRRSFRPNSTSGWARWTLCGRRVCRHRNDFSSGPRPRSSLATTPSGPTGSWATKKGRGGEGRTARPPHARRRNALRCEGDVAVGLAGVVGASTAAEEAAHGVHASSEDSRGRVGGDCH